MQDLQAFVMLRGSTLTPEEKKKVILESDNSLEGKLTVGRVSEAIRILGATFFQEMTGQKSTSKQKVYSSATLVTEHDDDEDQVYHAQEDQCEEEFIEALLSEGDTDAALVSDFEAAANELLQEDSDLAAAYSTYTEARRRLTEKFKNRGFWNTSRPNPSQSKGKGSFAKGGEKGKSSWNQKPRRSLQDRILNSYCRNCNRKGHWKAECPFRSSGSSMPGTPSGTSTSAGSQPTTTVSVEGSEDIMPMEFLHLPTVGEEPIDDTVPVLVSFCDSRFGKGTIFPKMIQGEYHGDNGIHSITKPTAKARLQSWGLRSESHEPRPNADVACTLNRSFCVPRGNKSLHHARFPRHQPDVHSVPRVPSKAKPTILMSEQPESATACFASHGSHGILDLGASKTVIGSQHLGELIRSLDPDIRRQLSRCPCNIVFKFGNQSTLTSSEALVVPIGSLRLKVAVVPGGTPFLISNTLMRTLRATIDCATQTLSSAQMSKPISLQLTAKGLFLLDINELIRATMDNTHTDRRVRTEGCAETFMSEETAEKNDLQELPLADHTHAVKINSHDEAGQVKSHVHACGETSDPQVSQETDRPTATDQARPFAKPSEPSVPPSSHVVVAKTTPVAGAVSCGTGGSRPPHSGGTVIRGGDVRTEVQWPHLRGHLAGSGVDPVHDQSLSEKSEGVPQAIHEVRRVEGRGSGTEPRGDSPRQPSGRPQPSSSQSQGHSQVPRCSFSHLFAGRERLGHSFRDVRASDYGSSSSSSLRGLDGNASSHVEHGERIDQSHPAFGAADQPGPDQCRGPGPVREDWDESVLTAMHHEAKHMKQLIQQFNQELQEIIYQTTPMGKPYELGEVMCSSNSPLTHQMLQLGKSAFRFGYMQGDLAQASGRKELFRLMARHRPTHVWYIPTCGPWSAWSQLNASRSMQHHDEYEKKRHDLLYQLALGIVLYRHQVSLSKHFHWEQPKRSLMFQTPLLAEVHEHTQACQFDMCRVGHLKDPENGMFMQKGMTLLTTFAPLFQQLHGMCCDHRHDHQAIEGSCRVKNGQSMLRTQYTEIYPRRFARTVAQVLGKGNQCWPYNWQPGMLCFATANVGVPTDEPSLAVTKVRKPPSFPKSEVLSPLARSKEGAKRSKTDPNQTLLPTLEMCQEAIQAVGNHLPRVGKTEITDQAVLNMLKNVFPDKRIHRVMACRGTDRTMAPPPGMHPQEAPFRKMLMLSRTGEVRFEAHWERWIELSKRQLIRPSHSCRINITVFAVDPKSTEIPKPQSKLDQGGQEEVTPDPAKAEMHPAPNIDQVESHLHEPPACSEKPGSEEGLSPSNVIPVQVTKPPNVEPVENVPKMHAKSMPSSYPEARAEEGPNTPSSAASRPLPECESNQHGPRFLGLPKWEQQAIIRMHKNLGHPSNDRLSRALQVSGARPEMVQAALEIRCATCAATAPPKHARPASLKTMMDFNHKIYLDGITWTNKMNKTFHFYHLLDAGTNYHIAIVAPSKTSEDLINLINQHWISWAGPPSEITVDSGTEMNSSEFATFLQRFNIRSTTTVPDAHWQSGRIERHGGFLQCMLEKVDFEHPINDYASLQSALNQCTHAKNSLSIRHGYAPEVIVFGKHSRIPGSVLSDESIPAHEHAMDENQSLASQDFRKMLALREAARRAFHSADNNEVLRRAALRRACPSRGQFARGDWVMIWKSNPLKQARWQGPFRVVLQDDNHTVWCTANGNLHRSAPENTRKACPEEGHPEGPELPEDITPLTQQIHRMQQTTEVQDTSTEIPLESNRQEESPNPIVPNPNNLNPNNSENSESQDGSLQPEPEDFTSEGSQTEHAVPNAEMTNDDPILATTEVIQLACQEVDHALTCHAEESLAWRCEFEIPRHASLSQDQNDEEKSWIMLATSSKKQRTEVKLSTLSPEEIKEFEKAKDSEIQNWIKTSTISAILRDQIPEEQILRCRWILTWKPIDNVGENEESNNHQKSHKAKARLVVLGYLDPRIEEIPRDSPTLNKTSRMIALQVISSHAWKLRSFDIKAAFLQGKPQADRIIAVDPVPELRRALQLKPQEICKLNKGAYGLIDAPYLWYCALVTELTRLGFETSPFDPCCFVLRSPHQGDQPGKLEGILGIHVDDGIGGGSSYFEEKIHQLEQKFAFGSHKISAFTFTGIEVTQHTNYNISLSQSSYVRKIPSITVEPNRKSQPELPVNESERLSLRGLIGSLQYAAINTRPDLSSKLSFLQSAINTAKVETLMEANRVLHEAKRNHDVTITIKSIPVQQFQLMAFSDASFSSVKKPDSHAGSIIVGTHQDISRGLECPITWGCRKIQKVVTSTLSAETMALATTLDQLSWLRLFWSWIHDPRVNWKKPEETLPKLEPAITVPTLIPENDVAITDCKSLYDLITRTAPPSCSEFRVQLMARSIKESLKEGTMLRWVPSGAQLADSLTKSMESHFLRETLKYGFYRLSDEDATLKERARSKDRLKWLKAQNGNSQSDHIPA